MGRWLGKILARQNAVQGFVASPSGSSTNAGTLASPWDLQTALNGGFPANTVQPGNTINLRGGTYSGNFNSTLRGTAGNYITVRSYPGEWAHIQNTANTQVALLDIGPATPSQFTIYRDFEISPNSANPNRNSTQGGSFPTDIFYGDAVDMAGADNCLLVHLVMHDCFNNFGSFGDSTNISIIGCLAYYSGWVSSVDGGHGHNFYVENSSPSNKFITGNIGFDSFSNNLQAYGAAAFDQNIFITHNFFCTAGKINAGVYSQDAVLGGSNPFENSSFDDNVIWDPNGAGSSFQAGYLTGSGVINSSIQNNYLYCSMYDQGPYTGSTIAGNTFFINPINGTITAGTFPSNSYLGGVPPGAPIVKTWTSPYEAGRAHVAIINPTAATSVAIDPSSYLSSGDTYVIRNGQDYFGTPVASGTWTSGTISVPMTGLTMAAPWNFTTPTTDGPNFGVFVVRKS